MTVTFDEWLAAGIQAGWCGPAVCSTHDGIPTSDVEDEQFEDGWDPCVHVIRLYPDVDTKIAVEANHPPTLWRAS